MDDEFLSDDNYKNQLNIEGLLISQLNRICMSRDTDKKQYCSSIETFILVCPARVREKAFIKIQELGLKRGDYSTITDDKMVVYDDLLSFVNEYLEKKEKIIWKKRSIKTYE
jgi:hypothetical protein